MTALIDISPPSQNAPVPGIDAVLDGELYISSLSCAQKILEGPSKFTHVVSVCPDLPHRNENHLVIPINDTEYDNIIDYLSPACQFIDDALTSGGCVLVHCVWGVSRSATIISAYLMKKQAISADQALVLLAKCRPRVFPNYGFVKQLRAFSACNYSPSPTHPAYRSWKRRQRQDVTRFLNICSDTTLIVPGLYLSSELPNDPDQLRCLTRYMGFSSILTVSETEIGPDTHFANAYHVKMPLDNGSNVVDALSAACEYIQDAIRSTDDRILVHSQTESIAALVVCTYLMLSKNSSGQAAVQTIVGALPLFEATSNFTSLLNSFTPRVTISSSPAIPHIPSTPIPVLATAVISATSTISAAATSATAVTVGLDSNDFEPLTIQTRV